MGRNLTRKKKGGKFLGQGSYGCAFLPTIACEGEDVVANDSISKLMRCEDAYDEYRVSSILKPIDPQQQYFLYPKRICKVDLEDRTIPQANIAKCGFSGVLYNSLKLNKTIKKTSGKTNDPCSQYPDISKKSPVSIQYVYGGKDLTEVNVPKDDTKIFMEDLNNLFEGLAKLHKTGFVHFDIKRENTVALKEANGHYKIRFIDFGFLTRPALYKAPSDIRDMEGLYYYMFYPYDTRFLISRFDERNISRDDIMRWQSLKLKSVVANGLPQESVASVNYESMFKLYIDLQRIDPRERRDMIMKKADVFMLGIILAEVYKQLFGISPSLSANPSTKSYKVANLVFHMTDSDVLERYTIDEAYEIYRSIFPRESYPTIAVNNPPPSQVIKTPPRPVSANQTTPPPPPQPPRIPLPLGSNQKKPPPPRVILPKTPPQENKTPPNPYEKTFQTLEKSIEIKKEKGINNFSEEITKIGSLYKDIFNMNPIPIINDLSKIQPRMSLPDFINVLNGEIMKLRKEYSKIKKERVQKRNKNSFNEGSNLDTRPLKRHDEEWNYDKPVAPIPAPRIVPAPAKGHIPYNALASAAAEKRFYAEAYASERAKAAAYEKQKKANTERAAAKPLTEGQKMWGVAPPQAPPKKQKYSRKTRKQRR